MTLLKRDSDTFPLLTILLIIALVILSLLSFVVCLCISRQVGSKKEINSVPNSPTFSPNYLQRFKFKFDNSLTLEKELSSGGFGTVYRGKLGKRVVAVKRLHFTQTRENQANLESMFTKEAKLMELMKHDNIVDLIQFDAVNVSIIMEFMEKGSLRDYISKARKLSWTERLLILKDICRGMAFLHSKKYPDGKQKREVLHQDLKSANVLLTTSNGRLVAKISDFGLSFLKDQSSSSMFSSQGVSVNGVTSHYQAPELLGPGARVRL